MTEKSKSRRFDVLVTAAEAFPRLEEEFLDAKCDIVAGFRIFDPWTSLYSTRAKTHGDTWFDLIVATLNRGVRLRLILSDFDPVVRTGLHLGTWRSIKALLAAGEASDHPENLNVTALMHPARVGWLPRVGLWPRTINEIGKQISQLHDEGIDDASLLECAPPLVRKTRGKLVARKFPPPPLFPVSHHQKMAVFDDARLYVGGLDLNARRFDTPEHDRGAVRTWHDVQVIVDGSIAKEARDHLLTLTDALLGRDVPHPRKLLRTISARRGFSLFRMSPKTIFREIATAHHDAIRQSEELIYFESQFFRDEELAQQLAVRAKEQSSLDMIMLLPAAPEEIAFNDTWGSDTGFGEHLQAKCIDIVQQAFGERLFVGSPVRPVRAKETDDRGTLFGSPIIYLHAKVSIFDAKLGIVSSANINGRSLNWDTETGVQTQTPAEVAKLKARCFDHWLNHAEDQALYAMRTARAGWAGLAANNSACDPEQRQGFVVPFDAEAGQKDARYLPGAPAEMV
ncbi:phospholipase D family protein [Yoonia sp. R2331]|uniref:phospholipase D family protein n=1 Tax=Yoonia sp. R2331 TaxID=3237238 RepID=UPI0034E4D75D